MKNIHFDGELSGPKFIFAHGAGAGCDHPFMAQMANALAQRGIGVIRFDFPYMVRQKMNQKKCPPDRLPKLIAAFDDVIASYTQESEPIVIGGKSMGGRIASMLTDMPMVAGVACLGFPFHPPGKPEKQRGEHLVSLTKPCLILQGERDRFGTKAEVETMLFAESVTVEYLPDGDHSFKPRKLSGRTEQQNLVLAADRLADFIKGVYGER